MGEREPQILEVGEGPARRRIAYLHAPGAPGSPGIIWLTGLKSDMVSTKATAIAEWAARRGLACTRFDYSGHGRSDGRFEDATIGDWLEEAVAIFVRVTAGPQIVAGSSTGGHMALLLLRRLMQTRPAEAQRIGALVLVAPAWDLTEELMWNTYPESARREILEKGFWTQPSAYDPAGYTITRRFIEEGRSHLFGACPWNPGRPVVILQGLKDEAVPSAHVRKLASFLEGGWASLTEVPDGDHRLSRETDLALLFELIAGQVARLSM